MPRHPPRCPCLVCEEPSSGWSTQQEPDLPGFICSCQFPINHQIYYTFSLDKQYICPNSEIPPLKGVSKLLDSSVFPSLSLWYCPFPSCLPLTYYPQHPQRPERGPNIQREHVIISFFCFILEGTALQKKNETQGSCKYSIM